MRTATIWITCLFLLVVAPLPAFAQSGGEALFLLLPTGARAVALGETVVAHKGGSEQIWWNPAGIAGDSTKEIALHHSETVVGQGNAISYLMPFKRLGTFGVSLNMLDLGAQDATDDHGQIQGRISSLNFAYALTYATQLSKYVALGATVKHVQMRVSCSGLCTDLPVGGSRASGSDVGALLDLEKRLPLTLGLSVRNIGIGSGEFRATRVNFGGNYRVEAISKYTDQVDVYAAAGVTSTAKLDSASSRVGADIVFENWIHVRGGYIFDHANGSGASIGFGITTGRVTFDLARTFGGISADGDRPPTYFSLRYSW